MILLMCARILESLPARGVILHNVWRLFIVKLFLDLIYPASSNLQDGKKDFLLSIRFMEQKERENPLL